VKGGRGDLRGLKKKERRQLDKDGSESLKGKKTQLVPHSHRGR